MVSFDYSVVKHYKFYGFVKKVFGPIFRAVYKLEFRGLENVPQDKNVRYIVAVNHTCALDPVFASMPKNMPPLHFMAKVELFKNPIVGWVVKHLYGFPVKRGKGDTSAIDYGEKIIKEGHVMAICPEGRRVKDKNGVPQRAKSGVAIIAKATNASVLPCAIYCDGPIKPGKKVVVTYGKLLSLSDMGLDKEECGPHDIKDAANKVMGSIFDLWEASAQ